MYFFFLYIYRRYVYSCPRLCKYGGRPASVCPEMGQCPARVRAGEMVPVPCFRPGGHEDSWADAVPGRTPVLFWNGPVGLALAPEGHVKAKAWGGSGLGKSSRGTVRQRRLSWPPQLPCVPSSSCGLRPLPGLCSARPGGTHMPASACGGRAARNLRSHPSRLLAVATAHRMSDKLSLTVARFGE